MDFNDKDINNDMWEWQDEEYCLQKDTRNDFSHSLWDNMNSNEDNLMYMLEEQTPMKDCVDFGNQLYNVVDNAEKGLVECMETSQIKRRRMLQFPSDANANEIDIRNEEFTSQHLKSKVWEGSLTDIGMSPTLQWDFQLNTQSQDERSFNFEGWDQQASERWVVNCLNGSEMHRVNESEMYCSLNQMDNGMAMDDQVDVMDVKVDVMDDQVHVSAFCNIPHVTETCVRRDTPNPSPIKIVRGLKCLKTPKKLIASIAYPFAVIKPCGVEGDVTLRDINQKIHAPPPSKSKQKIDEDPSPSFPTSAFSGKPVVLKTKIRTEGGKGSITIMRTKG